MPSPDAKLFKRLAKQFSIIPLDGKRPLEKGWERWCKERRPFSPSDFQGRNAGVACGPASGVLVLDIDDQDMFQLLADANGWKVPSTFTVLTGKDRPHFYFAWPDGKEYGNHSCKHPVCDGHTVFDIRAIGGQVVAPGSIHPETGKSYRIGDERPFASCPAWLLAYLDGKEPAREVLLSIPLPEPIRTKFIGKLKVSQETRRLILEGVEKPGRSEAIMTVLNSLARYDEQTTFYVFRHYPIGQKWRDDARGNDEWLRKQILKARSWTGKDGEEHPGQELGRMQENESSPASEPDETHLLPEPPALPLEVFPPVYRAAIEQAAEAFAVPVEIPACSFLALASACVGRSRGIIAKDSWRTHGNLYLAAVAPSGLGKSPCTTAFLNSIFRVEAKWFKEWQDASEKYVQEQMDFTAARRSRPKNSASTFDFNDPPQRPTRKQIYIDDATIESVADALASNPRGVLWYRDELAGLLLDMDKYNGREGATKTRLMTAFDCGPWKTSRSNESRNQYIRNACVSIFGTIQPGALPTIFNDLDAATGFLPRFLFVRAVPKAPPLWTDAIFEARHRDALEHMTEALLRMDFDDAGEPVFIDMQREALSVYVEWFNRQALEPWTNFDAQAHEALAAKLRGYALRLALILHIVEAVAEGRSERQAVSVETMRRAVQLADWFKEHQRQVWKFLGKAGQVTEASPLERRVAAGIVAMSDEIDKGRLFISAITEKVNAGVPERFRVASESIGLACKEIGLRGGRTSSGRFVHISPEKLTELRDVVGVTGMTVAFKPVTPEGKRQSCDSDSHDGCDGFKGNTLSWTGPDKVVL